MRVTLLSKKHHNWGSAKIIQKEKPHTRRRNSTRGTDKRLNDLDSLKCERGSTSRNGTHLRQLGERELLFFQNLEMIEKSAVERVIGTEIVLSACNSTFFTATASHSPRTLLLLMEFLRMD